MPATASLIRLWTVSAALSLSVQIVSAQEAGTSIADSLGALIEGEPVYVVRIDGMIDNALARYVDRAIADATAAEAGVIVFHIDTFGGLVDAADEIRKAILDSSPRTIALIDKNAASAGALISYACDYILMVPGASIGAATVVEGTGGEAAPDKYQSYMRGLMRATAEANGRDPSIAEAMVDQDLEVEGISEAGEVLTLSTEEALRFGVADFEVSSLEELLNAGGVDLSAVVNHRATGTEKLLRFFASPVIQSILMLMMLGGLYFELQTPGVGFAGAMAGLGAAMFFAPHYMLGLVESWEIIVFILGIGLIVLEIFVIPGFGVAGIAGIVLTVGALGSALVGNVGLDFPSGEAIGSAVTTIAVTLVLFVVLLVSMGRFLPDSRRMSQLILSPELSSVAGYVAAATSEHLLGRHGTAVTTLRPSGVAEIDGERVDVVAQGTFVASGANVVVKRVSGSRVEVVEIRETDETSSA
jgi:membrane-bound serine protease (ClpP class)